jgi:hypothetical protein
MLDSVYVCIRIFCEAVCLEREVELSLSIESWKEREEPKFEFCKKRNAREIE